MTNETNNIQIYISNIEKEFNEKEENRKGEISNIIKQIE